MKNNGKTKSNSSLSIKKILLFLIIVLCTVGGIGLVYSYKQSQQLIQNDEQKKADFAQVLKESKETNEIIGQKPEFKKVYGVDSQKVWNAMNTYDYNNDGKKEVFLTFDDGPSLTNTPHVLKILQDNNVKGTFFVMGKSLKVEGAPAILRKVYDAGMAIGNHSYSHDYKHLYPHRVLSMNNFLSDFNYNDTLIKNALGKNFKTRVIRCPGGQISWKKTEPLTQYLIKNNMTSMDWNALNGDAEGPKKNAEQLYQEAIKTSHNKNLVVLLMHDTYGKEETVKALDKIIKYFKQNGYSFKTLV